MKLGLQINNFTWEGGGPAEIGRQLGEIVRTAEAAGYTSIWVMDHYFQIPNILPAENEMLEAYTALGYIAGQTSKVRLGTLVTGVTYRPPGILAKKVTTLDVLSGGRANFGIGAAWFDREHAGLGVPFPPLKERYERLEEALLIAFQMWDDDNNGPYQGKHYQLTETLNVPQALSKPHPPVMIGGSGERKTLKLVARYANACNIFGHRQVGGAETVKQKLEVLRRHCEDEGRNYDDIEKTAIARMDVGRDGEKAGELVEFLGEMAEAGAQTVMGSLRYMENLRPLEIVGRDVIPQIAKLNDNRPAITVS